MLGSCQYGSGFLSLMKEGGEVGNRENGGPSGIAGAININRKDIP